MLLLNLLLIRVHINSFYIYYCVQNSKVGNERSADQQQLPLYTTNDAIDSAKDLRYDDHFARDFLLMLCPLRRISAAYLYENEEFATERDTSEAAVRTRQFFNPFKRSIFVQLTTKRLLVKLVQIRRAGYIIRIVPVRVF